MSFMPNVATVVEMEDGRVGVVSHFTPTGDDDRIMFSDGHEERFDQCPWKIKRLLTEEDEAPGKDPLTELKAYLAVDYRELLKKYMDRVSTEEGVYFLYDDQQKGEDPPFTKSELTVLHQIVEELNQK